MRVVWVQKKIKAGDSVTARQFEAWRPGETLPKANFIRMRTKPGAPPLGLKKAGRRP